MEPVENVLGRIAEKQTLQAAARDGSHDDGVGAELVGQRHQQFPRAALVDVSAFRRNAVRFAQLRDGVAMPGAHRVGELVDRQRDRHCHGVRRDGESCRHVECVKRVDLAAEPFAELDGRFQDAIVEAGGLVAFMQRIDGCDEAGPLARRPRLDEPQRSAHPRIRLQSVFEKIERCSTEWKCVSLITMSASLSTAFRTMLSCSG